MKAALIVLVLLAPMGRAQSSLAGLSDEARLERVFAYQRTFRARIPSLEADASIITQEVKKGKVKWEVRFEAVVREFRDDKNSDKFQERLTFLTVDGKPYNHKDFKLPYYVNESFANSLGFDGPPNHACLDYRFAMLDDGATLRMTVDWKPEAGGNAACNDVPEQEHEVLLIDEASGAVKHQERTMAQSYSDTHHRVPEAAVDFAPQKLGRETVWLPVRVECSDPSKNGRMVISYSNFHRYLGETRILLDAAEGGPVVQ
jgi:hypothetical protein